YNICLGLIFSLLSFYIYMYNNNFLFIFFFFFSSRRRHTRCYRDWSSDVCSSDLLIRSRVSYIPAATDLSCGQSRAVCSPSHPAAGPWQLSQLTPSCSLWPKVFARFFSSATYSAWHARHLGEFSAPLSKCRMRAICT